MSNHHPKPDNRHLIGNRVLRTIRALAFHPLSIAVMVALIYLPSVSYPFVYDTNLYLLQSPFARTFPLLEMLRDIPGFVQRYTPLVTSPDYVVNFVLRPFCYLTFHLNYLVGGATPEGYRIVNIAIHLLTALLLYGFVRKLLTRSGTDLPRNSAKLIAFFCAELYAVNPLETEAVIYTVQRFTSLGGCLYLAALYAHLLAMEDTVPFRRTEWQVVSIISLILGMLTMEFVFTAPFMILLLNLIIRRDTVIPAIRNALPQLCCLPLIPLLLMLVTRGDKTPGASIDDMINIVNFKSLQPLDYLTIQIRAVSSYFRMVLLPWGQSFLHSYPRHTSLMDGEVLLSLAIITLFIVTACRLARRRDDTLAHLIAFFIFWFFVTISVTSSVIPLAEIFSERRVYLPSVGIICGMVLHLVRTGTQWKWHLPVSPRRLAMICGIIAVALYAGCAMHRTKVWQSRLTLWQNVVDRYPRNPVALNDLGNEYLNREAYDKAIPYLRKSLAITPSLKVYQNLGAAYLNGGRYRKAIITYQQGLNRYRNDYLLLAGAGAANCLAGEPAKALVYLERAISIDPERPLAQRYLRMATERLDATSSRTTNGDISSGGQSS